MNELEKIVYDIICSDEMPPEDHHWEGFVAGKIVKALEPYMIAPADMEELVRIAKLVDIEDPFETEPTPVSRVLTDSEMAEASKRYEINYEEWKYNPMTGEPLWDKNIDNTLRSRSTYFGNNP